MKTKINKMSRKKILDVLKKTAEHQGPDHSSKYAKALLARLEALSKGGSNE